jgi:hypothetical protein
MGGGNIAPNTNNSDPVGIDCFAAVISDGLKDLLTTLYHVETTLSHALPQDPTLTSDAIRVLQSLDRARQNARDLLGLMHHVDGKLNWAPGVRITPGDLVSVVDMRDTLAALSQDRAKPHPSDDLEMWL